MLSQPMNLNIRGSLRRIAPESRGTLFIGLSVYPDERLKEQSGCSTVVLSDILS